ncbi:winged helix DNA-binding domain-containing protein [Lysobacter sp. S4-A87]|uniref:winged helix-turn-helix domain-containing protein n=1 Tax=Lysobacter sp. S4-A87 TaxID=2925843 RepID=UPI001F5342E9|nr:crosslink repair DNA glycosylase YcaQ family protein [Lysobacter sp. S4-A87]UNK49311.1 winged helix DNA-binding domain-containing protein [Lysobacter sp. S4-A87]
MTGAAAALAPAQARALHLAAQGLATRPRRRAGKADLLAAIARMQLLQIDTIHVVARSPYLVLFSRVGAYPAQWLEELLAQRDIFETWAHEACFAPSADYTLLRSAIDHRAHHWAIRNARHRQAEHGADIALLLAHVRERGAVKAADFEREAGSGSGGGWWQWKDEKLWLETAFALGDLMVSRRENFHRVYDLAERVIGQVQPDWDNAVVATDLARRELLLKSVRALGIAQARWIADYYRLRPRLRDSDLDGLVEEGALLRVEVKGWQAPGYVHRDLAPQLAMASAGRLRATHATLLSPFDPVVWDRERASEFFGFDYTLECYTPEPKRRYGYFVLPILVGGRLVGRLDAKAHRREGVFEVKALYLEDGIAADDSLAQSVARAIDDCARWHATPRVALGRCRPASFARMLRAQLAAMR